MFCITFFYFGACIDPLKYFQFCELKVYESKLLILPNSQLLFFPLLSTPKWVSKFKHAAVKLCKKERGGSLPTL